MYVFLTFLKHVKNIVFTTLRLSSACFNIHFYNRTFECTIIAKPCLHIRIKLFVISFPCFFIVWIKNLIKFIHTVTYCSIVGKLSTNDHSKKFFYRDFCSNCGMCLHIVFIGIFKNSDIYWKFSNTMPAYRSALII